MAEIKQRPSVIREETLDDGMETTRIRMTIEDYRVNRHGDHNCGEGVFEPGTGFLLFNDGCVAREISSALHGAEPLIEVWLPKDEGTRLQHRARFLEASIAQMVAEYRFIRADVAESLQFFRLGAGPAPSRGWEAMLEKLSTKILHQQELLATLREMLPVNVAREEFQKMRGDREDQAREQMHALKQFPTL